MSSFIKKKLLKMSDDERTLLIKKPNIKPYLNRLIACNVASMINLLVILVIQFYISTKNFQFMPLAYNQYILDYASAAYIKTYTSAYIMMLILYNFLISIQLIKNYLYHKILMINSQFNLQINKSIYISTTLYIIETILLISCTYLMLFSNSTLSLLVAITILLVTTLIIFLFIMFEIMYIHTHKT